MQRLSITVEDDLAAFVRREVEAGRAASVSAYVATALRQRAEERVALLDELDREAGHDPADEPTVARLARMVQRPTEWVRDALGLPS